MNGKWISYILTLFVVTVVAGGLLAYQQYEAKEQYRISLENQYQLSFRELVDDVENLEVQTAKALVSNSPRQTMINLSDIWRNAYDAQANLARLPLSHDALSRTEKFLTQMGDFSYSIAKTTSPQITLTAAQWNTMNDLYTQARYLSGQLHQLEANVDKGQLSWTEIERKSSNKLAQVSGNLINTNFRVVERQMLRYPTLTYDGPFSDQLHPVPLGLTNQRITTQQALAVAKEYVDPAKPKQYEAKKIGEGNGQIATYSLQVQPDTNNAYVAGPKDKIFLDVSKSGGQVVWMVNNRNVQQKKLTFQEALTKAQEFLRTRGYPKMVLTSYSEFQRTMFFSFAYQQDGVTIYPDLVKVKVALDNGQIIGVEAANYLMSHHYRHLNQPNLTLEEARKKLNPRLKVEKSKLVLIPSEGHDEILCYEFLVGMNTNRFLVYINASNGREQNILRLIEAKNLQLAM